MKALPTLIVTASALNLRPAPNTSGKPLAVLPKHSRVRVLGLDNMTGWAWVTTTRPRPMAGYVATPYTAPGSAYVTPAWMTVADEERGVKEITGKEHHPRIIEYHAATLLKATTDEVPWCSSFACWCMEQVRIPSPRSAAARDWLRWGRPLEEGEDVRGAVAVFRRGTGGHVGFVEEEHTNGFVILGGNQGNAVRSSVYARGELLGLRMPA